MMDSNSSESREPSGLSGIDKLMTAHNEIINAWFSHWGDQERSRIELAFDNKAVTRDKHPA